jgi:5-methylcytosine-specific restriction endonuclease McrA
MASWQDLLDTWRHNEPHDPDPARNKQFAEWLLQDFRRLRRTWEFSQEPPANELELVARPPKMQGPPIPPVGINYSYEILLEVEERLGMNWYEQLTMTVAPAAVYVSDSSRWAQPPRLAYWISPTDLYLHDLAPQSLVKLLIEKRACWHEHIGNLSHKEAWQRCSIEFNNFDFGAGIKQCKQCDEEFGPFSNIIEFAETDAWQLLNSRRFCSQECRHEYNWHDTVRRGMQPQAEFDKSVTRDAVWKRYGPRCYLCGLEVFYDQADLSLRNKSKAWKVRWGDVDKYDVNRQAVVEHVLPRSKGGSHTWDNVQIACSRCNLQKSDQVIYLSEDGNS